MKPGLKSKEPFERYREKHLVQIREKRYQKMVEKLDNFLHEWESRFLVEEFEKERPELENVLRYIPRSSKQVLLMLWERVEEVLSEDLYSARCLGGLTMASKKTERANKELFKKIVDHFYREYILEPNTRNENKWETHTKLQPTITKTNQQTGGTCDSQVANCFLKYISNTPNYLHITHGDYLFPLLGNCDEIFIRWYSQGVRLDVEVVSEYLLEGILFGRNRIVTNVVYIIPFILSSSPEMLSATVHLLHQILTDNTFRQEKGMLFQTPDIFQKMILNIPYHLHIILQTLKNDDVLDHIIRLGLFPDALGMLVICMNENDFQKNLVIIDWVSDILYHPQTEQILTPSTKRMEVMVGHEQFMSELFRLSPNRLVSALVIILKGCSVQQFTTLNREYRIMEIILSEARCDKHLVYDLVEIYAGWYTIVYKQQKWECRGFLEIEEIKRVVGCAQEHGMEQCVRIFERIIEEIKEGKEGQSTEKGGD